MKVLIKVGVALNLLIGLGHLLCMAALDKIFAIYGIGDVMDRIAQYGAYLPYVITVIIALAFFAVALYGLSALKAIPRLPLQTTAMTTIVVVFSGRVIWGLTMLIRILRGSNYRRRASHCCLPCATFRICAVVIYAADI